MSGITRYAIYWLPEGALGAWGEGWLGWSMQHGKALAQPDIVGLPRPVSDLTRAASTYGLHATIKPPFRLAQGQSAAALFDAFRAYCATRPGISAGALRLCNLDGFLALTPDGNIDALNALAAGVVRSFDHFRAAASADELSRRRAAGLNATQEAMLARWGYPYVMQEFRFHVTLTGRLTPEEGAAVQAIFAPLLQPLLQGPLHIRHLALVGEQQDGGFRTLAHHTLAG